MISSAATWGVAPPAMPRFGAAWFDANLSVVAPTLKVFDGVGWVPIGIVNTSALTLTPFAEITTIASAATTDLTLYKPTVVVVSGTATISSFGSTARSPRLVKLVVFAGAATLTYAAGTLNLPSAANLLTALGDVAVLQENGAGGWSISGYFSAGISSASGGVVVSDGTTTARGVQELDVTGGTVSASTGKATLTGVVQQVRIPLTSTQLLALNASPVSVLSTPGSNKAIIVLASVYRLIYGTTTYVLADGGKPPGLYYGTDSTGTVADGAAAAAAGVFTQTAHSIASFTGGVAPVAFANVANKGVVLSVDTGEMTTGNGTGTLTVFYTVVNL